MPQSKTPLCMHKLSPLSCPWNVFLISYNWSLFICFNQNAPPHAGSLTPFAVPLLTSPLDHHFAWKSSFLHVLKFSKFQARHIWSFSPACTAASPSHPHPSLNWHTGQHNRFNPHGQNHMCRATNTGTRTIDFSILLPVCWQDINPSNTAKVL